MSFSRIKSAGWGVNEILTSAQITALDLDHSRALDKTTAGDTLSGAVALASTARLNAASGAQINLASGSSLTVASGGVVSVVQYPVFPTPKTLTRAVPTCNLGGTGWTSGITYITGTATPGAVGLIPINAIIADGSTLTTLEFGYTIPTGHGGLPAVYGVVEVIAVNYSGTAITLTSPSVNYIPASTPGSVGAYEASGLLVTYSLPLTTHNVIDKSAFNYMIAFSDENGANAIAGTKIYMPTLTMTTTDMRPW